MSRLTFHIGDLHSEEERGPEAPRPPPKVCSKCWAESQCMAWNKYPNPRGGTPLFWHRDRTVEFYECPTHGYFEEKDGVQVFDDVELWVTGPDGGKAPLTPC